MNNKHFQKNIKKNTKKYTKDNDYTKSDLTKSDLIWFAVAVFVSYLFIDMILFYYPDVDESNRSSVGRLIAGIALIFFSNRIWIVLFNSDKLIATINMALWYIILIITTLSAYLVVTTGYYYSADGTSVAFRHTDEELYIEYGLLILCPILLLMTFYLHTDYLVCKQVYGKNFEDWFDDKFGKDDDK